MTSPFDSITIGPLTLRNRFIKSGANEAMSRDGVPTKAMLKPVSYTHLPLPTILLV